MLNGATKKRVRGVDVLFTKQSGPDASQPFRLKEHLLPDASFKTMYQVIEVNHNLVLRVLCDLHRVDGIVLFEDRGECEAKTNYRIPHNARVHFLLFADKRNVVEKGRSLVHV